MRDNLMTPTPPTIVEIDMKTRHSLIYRLLTYIGQDLTGRTTNKLADEVYIYEGLFESPQQARPSVNAAFTSARNVGLMIDVSFKQGKGFQLAVAAAGRRYYPILENGLPEEAKRREKFGFRNIVEIFEENERKTHKDDSHN